jgi:hypothetical protein
MNHTQLLNYLVDKYNLQSYLEIGVQNPANNFDRIKVAKKWAVDPCLVHPFYKNTGSAWAISGTEWKYFSVESDKFFRVPKCNFDLIFIDGLHHADQVQRDFENSLKCLNDGGFIVIHDCLPEKEETTHVPRDSKCWHGDVYKWAMKVYCNYQFVNFVTLNVDCGCMLVWKEPRQLGPPFILLGQSFWDFYIKNRKDYMRIIEPSEIEKHLPNSERVTI